MTREARFAAAMATIARHLPFGLANVVAPSVVGYLLINLCTFCIDLVLLYLFHSHPFHLPLPIAVTLSYGTAGVVSYIANRIMNFQSHGDVGKQFPVYVVVMASNYFIFVLGLTNGLAALGVYFEIARLIAACVEGVYLYCCMRWIVFRDALATPAASAPPVAPAAHDTTPEPKAPEDTSRPEPVGHPDH
jgi:putative flippase GtrA